MNGGLAPYLARGKSLGRYLLAHPNWLAFIIPALFYGWTTSPSIGWTDATLAVTKASNLDLGIWVQQHNLFQLLGFGWLQCTPFWEPPYSINLLCALFGSLAVGLTFVAGHELTGSRAASALGAGALMVCHSLWWHSTMAEVYSLNAALQAGIALGVIRFAKSEHLLPLLAAVLLFGLGCSNHLLIGLYAPAFLALLTYAFWKRMLTGWRPLLKIGLAFLAGFALYVVAFIQTVINVVPDFSNWDGTMQAIGEVVDYATGARQRQFMFSTPKEGMLFWRIHYASLWVLNFPSIALPAGIVGLYQLIRRPKYPAVAIFFLIGLVVLIVWSANIFVWDMFAFCLPALVLFAMPVIVGITEAVNWGPRWRRALWLLAPTVAVPLVLYPALPGLFRTHQTMGRVVAADSEELLPSHLGDQLEYLANPNKREFDQVERISLRVFASMPRGSHFFCTPGGLEYPMREYYQKILKIRPDIKFEGMYEPFFSPKTLPMYARKVEESLNDGRPVFIDGIRSGHRQVLNYLYFSFAPDVPRTQVVRMSNSDFLASFPMVKIIPVPIFPEEGIEVYRFEWR